MQKKTVLVETIVLEAPDEEIVDSVRRCFGNDSLIPYINRMKKVRVPKEATRTGVAANTYDDYRLSLISACADVVCVWDTDGKMEVPLISRAKPPFQGGWWVQGGAIFNFQMIAQFALWKLYKEAGQTTDDFDTFISCAPHRGSVRLIAPPLGIYRTAAEDSAPGKVADTLNVAYLALWPTELRFGHDKDHTAVRWVTLPELLADGYLCGHWYPQYLATRALRIVAAAKE